MFDIKEICRLYNNNSSIRDIAALFDTYPNKIARILKKAGVTLRTKEEAAKLAVEAGKIVPPMLGKKRTQEEKDNISLKRSKKWKELSDDELNAFKQGAKYRWNSQSEEDKVERQRRAGQALRKASVEGSKAEKFLYNELTKAGYDVIMHKKGLISGEKYEVDLFLPKLMVAIEIDGPQHFLPIYGEDNLNRNMKYDSVKNGALISRGICVIRIKYMLKHNSQTINRKLFDSVSEVLNNIQTKFPDKSNLLIEMEINND